MKVWKWMNIWPKKMPRLVITRRMSLLHTLLMASAKEGTTQACSLPSCLSQSLGTSVIQPASASHCGGDHPPLPPPPPPDPAFDLQIWSLNSRWFYCSLKSSKILTLPLPSLEERKTCICDDMLGFFHLSRSSIMPVRTNGARMKTNSPRSCVYGASLSWNEVWLKSLALRCLSRCLRSLRRNPLRKPNGEVAF